jgi:phosphohistidine phosphatase
MKCYFLRHGLAGDSSEWKGRDFDRPLTSAGCERMGREAKTIDDLALDLDCIVTSPLVRARQTAEIVAQRLGLRKKLVEDERLAGGFNAERLAEILQAHADADALMLVGHEPTMSATIGRLIGGAHIELKKGALACVEIADPASPRGTLLALIPPKVLAT